MTTPHSRRRFLQTSSLSLAGGLLAAETAVAATATAEPDVLAGPAPTTATPPAPLGFGYVGTGIRFHELIGEGCQFGPCRALCDVDAVQRGRGLQSTREQHYRHGYPLDIYDYEDYRRVLDHDDVDVVVIATPDHWHTKIAIEAMQAGKDVYCEKPLTLTIREGQQILAAIEKTGRVMQVGTQQRTEFGKMFAQAAALVHDGRVGDVQTVTCAIGGSMESPPLPAAEVPKNLNWDVWQGQTLDVPYRSSGKIMQLDGYGAGHPYTRTHNYFRWWYEYSGGKLTDWG
ncbi:MAG: Gfo/Idh/MocA family oxidoreductase, partial [Planctomycetales bacterium]|nr:Gfo/Idh/MocA family oxidoreductase [Planctomycetales bacterium]